MRLAALACLLFGCASTVCHGVREYQPYLAPIAQPKYVVFAAAERTVREMGAARVDVIGAELRLDAILSHDWAQKTREHLRLSLDEQGRLAIEIRTEMESDTGDWLVPEQVCDGYTFEREKKIAQRILDAAAAPL